MWFTAASWAWALITLALTEQVIAAQGPGDFSLVQERVQRRNGTHHRKNPYRDIERAHLKYGKKIPKDVQNLINSFEAAEPIAVDAEPVRPRAPVRGHARLQVRARAVLSSPSITNRVSSTGSTTVSSTTISSSSRSSTTGTIRTTSMSSNSSTSTTTRTTSMSMTNSTRFTTVRDTLTSSTSLSSSKSTSTSKSSSSISSSVSSSNSSSTLSSTSSRSSTFSSTSWLTTSTTTSTSKSSSSSSSPCATYTSAPIGSVAATSNDAYDDEYLIPVQIGTPPQTLPLQLDTGSSDLWVFSTDTDQNEVNGQTLYNPKLSCSSKKVQGATWGIGYGDGSSASGIVYTDVVDVGGVLYQTQYVESALKVSKNFTDDRASSGILGLAMSPLNTIIPGPQNTFMENVLGAISEPLFTANLKHQAAGTYDFGFINTASYTGSITYTPADPSSNFWQFTASGYQVGTQAFKSTSIVGIADTGTTLLLLPKAVVDDYHSTIPYAIQTQAEVYLFPCTTTPPDFYFGVGAHRGFIPGKYMNYGFALTTGGRDYCMSAMQISSGLDSNIWGDIMFKAQFVVFDYGSNGNARRLGFANKPTN